MEKKTDHRKDIAVCPQNQSEADRLLGQKIRELTAENDVIVKRKKGGNLGIYSLKQEAV